MRIAITGIGVVSPFGVGRERFWDARQPRLQRHARDHRLRRVRSAVPRGGAGAATSRSTDLPPVDGRRRRIQRIAPIRKRYSRAALIGVIAAREAWNDAGLRAGEPDAGVIIGSGGGGIDVGERQYHDFFVEQRPQGHALRHPDLDRRHDVERDLDLAAAARHQPRAVVRLHELDRRHRLRRGADPDRARPTCSSRAAPTRACTPGMIFGFSRMRVVSTRYNDRPAQASRPFDRGRDGFVLGEGAWMVVLEREDRARARGAHIYASHRRLRIDLRRLSPRADGSRTASEIVRAMTLALERSGRAREEIGYVNYHGTSTLLERRGRVALRAPGVRARADRVPGSSIKSMIGHPQGASGAAGVVTDRARADAAVSCRRRST